METLGAFLDAVTAADPERDAIAYAPWDRVTARLTRGALRAASRVAARKLIAAGVVKGMRVGLLCPNRLEWLPIAFGALRVGAVLVPFSTLWKRDEIAYGLAHGDVGLLLTVPHFLKHDYIERLYDILPALRRADGPLYAPAAPALRQVILLDGDASGMHRWGALADDVDDAFLDALERTVSATDLATIFFTSGTTAQAKAVVHDHAALTT